MNAANNLHSALYFAGAVICLAAACFAAQVNREQASGQRYNHYLQRFNGQPLLLTIADDLNDPEYQWPRTLVSYPVVFDKAGVAAEQLRLTHVESGKNIPIQLSEIRATAEGLRFARLHFFSDLPRGGQHRFALTTGVFNGPAPTAAGAALLKGIEHTSSIGETVAAGVSTINTGALQIRLPVGAAPEGQPAPGPLLQFNRGKGWVGRSYIAGTAPVTGFNVRKIDNGPLFITYEFDYQFKNGGRYTARVRCILGYEFVELSETMSGVSASDNLRMEFAWEGLQPTHRHAAMDHTRQGAAVITPIDAPVKRPAVLTPEPEAAVKPFQGHDPAWNGGPYLEEPGGEMICRLAPFRGNAVTPYGPHLAFWDSATGDETGLFVQHTGRWKDPAYSIHTAGPDLQVRFRFAPDTKTLIFSNPIVTGIRHTAIAFYDRETAQQRIKSHPYSAPGRATPDPAPLYPQWLYHHYAAVTLDRVKDWELKPGSDLALWTQHNADPHQFEYESPSIELLAAYLAAMDEYDWPYRVGLAGAPNIAAMVWRRLAQAAHRFPAHPMARDWLDQAHKALELAARFYLRPAVPAWNSWGGRPAGSAATYGPLELQHSAEIHRLGELTDGVNRLSFAGMQNRLQWLLHSTTSPVAAPADVATTWRAGMPLLAEFGFQRRQSDTGLESTAYAAPDLTPYAYPLRNYAPLLAENMLFASYGARYREQQKATRLSAKTGFYAQSLDDKFLTGTRFHPTSRKWTGYGVTMRAAVNSPRELMVQLLQFDRGPNYRWNAKQYQGGGEIVFTAAGRRYTSRYTSSEKPEGELPLFDDTSVSNFGIWKHDEWCSIGIGPLKEAFYNLDEVQLARITPITPADHPTGKGVAYSWPEYRSRSVLLAGDDYFVVYDHTTAARRRFAWYAGADGETFPYIYFATPAGDLKKTEVRGVPGLLHDTSANAELDASSMAVVSHQADVTVNGVAGNPGFNAAMDQQVETQKVRNHNSPVRVNTAGSHDYIFWTAPEAEIRYDRDGVRFQGSCGIVRQHHNGDTTLSALDIGEARPLKAIGARGVILTAQGEGFAASGTFNQPPVYAGDYTAAVATPVTVGPLNNTDALYVDGQQLEGKMTAGLLNVTLPAGSHTWELAFAGSAMRQIVVNPENTWKGGVYDVAFRTPALSKTTIRWNQQLLHFAAACDIRGVCESAKGGKLSVEFIQKTPTPPGESFRFYIDGQAVETARNGSVLSALAPPGKHYWEVTGGKPQPSKTTITATTHRKGGAEIYWITPGGAEKWRLEVSHDIGATWESLGEVDRQQTFIDELPEGEKLWVRVIAINGGKEGEPADDYPVYVTSQPPAAPSGLRVITGDGRAYATWGNVLGAQGYRLYRRVKGVKQWQPVPGVTGLAHLDATAAGAVPSYQLPGLAANADKDMSAVTIYEYAVSSYNPNGESNLCQPVDTDPRRWNNWFAVEPSATRFDRRRAAFWQPPYVLPSQTPPAFYPEAK